MEPPNPQTVHGLVIIVTAIFFTLYGIAIGIGELGRYFDPPASSQPERGP